MRKVWYIMAYIHRMTLLMPANRIAAFNAWFKTNISNDSEDAITVGLNASGDMSAATHYWCSIALNDPQGEALIDRLVTQAVLTKPANWNSLDRNGKKAWLNSVVATVKSRIGVAILYTNNDDKIWDDVEVFLAAQSLRRRGEMNPNG